MNQVIDSNKIIIFFFEKLFLFNYMIKKLDNSKIEHQPYTTMQNYIY